MINDNVQPTVHDFRHVVETGTNAVVGDAVWGVVVSPDFFGTLCGANLRAPVLGLYGAEDQGIPLDTVDQMKAALDAAGDASRFVVYQWGV